MARLQDRVALVTGAASGLGREIALKYASHGVKLVVIADIQDKPTIGMDGDQEYTVAKITRLYGDGKAIFVKTDVTDSQSMQAAVRETVKLGGRLDIMVNNAGIGGIIDGKAFHEGDDDSFDKTMNINVRGVYLGSKFSIAQMITQTPDASCKRGRVLNIASILGLRGIAGGARTAAYTCSKGAVMNLSRTLALEYKDNGININALCPGFLKTALTADLYEDKAVNDIVASRGGWGDVRDVAHAAVFLVSDEANWVHGIGLPVDGGWTAG